MLSLLSSWFVICSISLQNFTVNAGVLLIPLNLLTASFITEVYGYKNARRAIWCGFIFNILSIFYALVIINLPNPDYAIHNLLFDSIFNTYLKTSFFFILSHLFAESLLIFFIAKIKLKFKGYFLKIRLFSCVFFCLFFSDTLLCFAKNFGSLIHLEFSSMLFINTIITLIYLPVVCYIIAIIKKIEKIDIYDLNTRFNFFKFDVHYILSNNKFKN